jgi:hypothetical protein
MSLGACLPGLEAEGKLTAEQAAEARALYEERLAAHAATGSRETAEALASEDVLAALTRNVTRKEFLAGLAIKRRAAIEADLRTFGQGDARYRAVKRRFDGWHPKSIVALIDPDPRARYRNAEMLRQVIVGDAHREIDKVLADHNANLLGQVRNKAQLRDLSREAHLQDSGNPQAKKLIEGWRRAAEQLRQRRNRAGGDVGFRTDWGVPHVWDSGKVRLAGYDRFLADIIDELAPERMVDQRTGLPLTRTQLIEILPDVFETMRSGGLNKLQPGAMGIRSFANRGSEPRFLVFKDADAWERVNEKYGSGTFYDAMVHHVEREARDIAAMEVLGPNPAATIEWLKGTLLKQAGMDRAPNSKAERAAADAARLLDRVWAEYSGANMATPGIVNEVGSAYRAYATARFMGGAYLSAMSDFAFQTTRRKFNGLPVMPLFRDYVKLMRPNSIEDQRMLIRRGLIADEFSNRTAAQSRYMMEELTSQTARTVSSGVLRLSLLSRHTQTMRWLYGKENLATFTEAALGNQTFDRLAPQLRNAMGRYGLGAAEWDKLRLSEMDMDGGALWLAPLNMKGADKEIGENFMRMVLTETQLAVPVSDLKTRALMNSIAPVNGPWQYNVFGQLARSGPLMFKSFGIGLILRQGSDILKMQPAVAARYAGALITLTTLAGALSLQLRQLAQGKDLLPMADVPFFDEDTGEMEWSPGFWGRALATGGGFGVLGDLITASESRTGNGLVMTAAGVLPQDAQKIGRALGNPEKYGVRTAKQMIPGNNLWYARAALDRLMADQIEEYANPGVMKDWRELERKMRREQGTAYWWAPGDTAPERAPDFANALEEGPEQ